MELCNGKVSYQSEHEARRVKIFVEKNHSTMRVYQCPHCWNWHLTKQMKTDTIYEKMKKVPYKRNHDKNKDRGED